MAAKLTRLIAAVLQITLDAIELVEQIQCDIRPPIFIVSARRIESPKAQGIGAGYRCRDDTALFRLSGGLFTYLVPMLFSINRAGLSVLTGADS